MSSGSQVAQRAAGRRMLGPIAVGVLAALICVTGLVTGAQSAQAHSSKKVVIVVGASGSLTSYYRSISRDLARIARGYGAHVVQITSPYATWSRVRSAVQGANLLIYLGHGNGWPSKHRPFQTRTKDGLGLNAASGRGDYNTEYYGERFIRADVHLASNAVVLLSHLCYASGNPEWGDRASPLPIAKERVDFYAAGFLTTGAKVVFAEGLGDPKFVIRGLFTGNRTMRQIFWSSPLATPTGDTIRFDPSRSPRWAKSMMDPDRHYKGVYYRSITGRLGMRASAWR